VFGQCLERSDYVLPIWALEEHSDVRARAHVLASGIEVTDQKTVEKELAKYRKLLESQIDERSNQLRESRLALRQ
jgi:hypothetical protein